MKAVKSEGSGDATDDASESSSPVAARAAGLEIKDVTEKVVG